MNLTNALTNVTNADAIRCRFAGFLLGVLCLATGSVVQASAESADTAFPNYRRAALEQRFRAEGELPRKPSAVAEVIAAARAKAAVSEGDAAALAAAARGMVIHAQTASAGWKNAAGWWVALSQSWRDHGHALSHSALGRKVARLIARDMARDALRHAAFSLYAAYRSTVDPAEAGRFLIAFGTLQDTLDEHVSAELSLTAGLAAADDAEARERLERVRRNHGFRILATTHDGDRDDPRLCVALSAAVAREYRRRIEDYIAVEPDGGDHPVLVREATVCVGNLVHGREYTVAFREGLQDVHGRTVVPERRETVVPDRPARIRFSRGDYVLPAVGSAGIPLTTVNIDRVTLLLLRVTDGNLVDAVMHGYVGRELSTWGLSQITERHGEVVRQETLPIEGRRNSEVVTEIAVDSLVLRRQPGVYVLAASEGPADRPASDRAAQWFVVSNIGLFTVNGADGLTVFARSLATGMPLAGTRLSLQARNEDTLAVLETDAHGRATFAPGLLRGQGGRKAVLLRARHGDDDHTFMALGGPGLDLSDRGVGGRPAPGPVRAWLYTDRGIYRPGATVHLTALVRDDRGDALTDLPLELVVARPDGVEAASYSVRSDDTGAIPLDYALAGNAVTGAWQFQARVSGDKDPVGALSVQVADFVPPRIEVALEAPDALNFHNPEQVTVIGRFLYGAPAADMTVTAAVRVEADPEPFAAWQGYRFGRVEDAPVPEKGQLPEARTGEDGVAALSVVLPEMAPNGHPMRARIDATVLERGGRPVTASITRPLRDGMARIGIRPESAQTVRMGAKAHFEIVALDGHGAAIGGRGLKWRLYREEREWLSYREPGGNWAYHEITLDTTVDSGAFQTSTDTANPARVTVAQGWGRYRLEVIDPGESGALPASVRFRVGWGWRDGGSDVPDRMTVRLDRRRYRQGDTVTARLEAPFDGPALVTVLTDGVAQAHRVQVVDGVGTVSFPVQSWPAGAYVAAMLFRPAPVQAEQGPGRAVGIAWLEVFEPARRLAVTFDAPATAPSGQPLRVPFRVADGNGSPVTARVNVAAVDEGILQMTGFQTPDPVAALFGQRLLAVKLQDLYGRLIEARRGRAHRSGGDSSRPLFGGIQAPQRTVALFRGLMRTDAQGRGEVVLDVPEGFSGRLRLMAVAHTGKALGHGVGRVIIRDPLAVDLYLPRFLAPGDRAQVTVEVVNNDAPAGVFTPALAVSGAAAVAEAPALPGAVPLAPGERWSMPVTLVATDPGDAVLRVSVAGPGAAPVERTWTLPVRPAQAWRQTQFAVTLAPGDRLNLTEVLVENLYPADTQVSASVSPLGYSLRGLLASLDRYPYGCTEQTVSRALPLLYVKELKRGAGSGGDGGSEVGSGWGVPSRDAGLEERIQNAVNRVSARQTKDGGFGVWSAQQRSEPWVSAYALDFLDRARSAGYRVEDATLRSARGYVAGLARSGFPTAKLGEALAYGYAVLGRSRAVQPGSVRHFINHSLSGVRSGLGRAQLALAAASLGLNTDAGAAFAVADAVLGGNAYLTYGSKLRDAAALVVVAATVQPDALGEAAARLRRIAAKRLGRVPAQYAHLSTQEKAWMVVAAWELTRAGAKTSLTVDGVLAPTGPRGFHRAIDPSGLKGDGVLLGNPGEQPASLLIEVGGHPVLEEPARARGVTIKRNVLTRSGAVADPDKVRQGDEVTVVLEGELGPSEFPRRLLVADLLPAGLEIQVPLIDDAPQKGPEESGALGKTDRPEALMLRDDRYVAALTLKGGESFRLAYAARAVTPGTFRVPAPYVEDMYDPSVQARGAMGRLTVHR